MSAGNSSLMSVILLVIGALLGAVITYLIAGQRSENEPDEQTTGPKRKQNNPPAELVNGGYTESIRLWRNAENHLAIEMNGVAFKTAKEMNPSAQETADGLARSWLAWLGKEAPPKTAPTASTVDDTVLEELKLSPPAATRASTKPLPIIGEEVEKLPEIPKESIVVQIDNILQDMLAGSALEERSIHLDEDANMGVVVWVGNTSFQGIDQVSDPIIATVIRKAVAEWERRSVPNR